MPQRRPTCFRSLLPKQWDHSNTVILVSSIRRLNEQTHLEATACLLLLLRTRFRAAGCAAGRPRDVVFRFPLQGQDSPPVAT